MLDLMMLHDQKFACAMTGQLLWYVQICDLIWRLFFMEQQDISLWNLDFKLINLSWNG